MERGECTVFFACFHWALLESDCVYIFPRGSSSVCACTNAHIQQLQKRKKNIFLFSETQPHKHMHTYLIFIHNNYGSYFLQPLLCLTMEFQPLSSRFSSIGYFVSFLGTFPALPFVFPYKPAIEGLSQPTAVCHHCRTANSRSARGAWWQSQERQVVAGMGPRQVQSSLNSDFCEQKHFFMKK